jgi:IS30 family transposase
MPYTHYNTDERNALQAMAGMGLPKNYMAVILGRHPSSIYREFSRNGSGGVYTGNEAQAASEQRRRDSKPGPKIDSRELMDGITKMFKADLPPDQISGRLRAEHPDEPEKQASTSTVYRHLYRKRRKTPRSKPVSGKNTRNPARGAARKTAAGR